MTLVSVILYWLTTLVIRKDYGDLKAQIKRTNWKLIRSFRHLFNIKAVIKNNFDLKPTILRWFFASFVCNLMFFIFTIVANIIHTPLFLYNFFNCSIYDFNIPWSWVAAVVINTLFIIFLIRVISDYYKLSLRGKYRQDYLKLLFLDIITINIFSIIGTLIFSKNRLYMVNNDNYSINYIDLESQNIKKFLKLIFKVETIILLFNLVILFAAIFTGYFVTSNNIKFACIVIIVWNIVFLYGWSIPRFLVFIIFRRMFKNLISQNDYHYLLTTTRFLVFGSGYYYFAVLINLFKLDENSMNFLLENW